jgi:hypothetical protein
MKPRPSVCIVTVLVLLAASCLPVLADDWEWVDAGSDWETESWDSGGSSWDWTGGDAFTASPGWAVPTAGGQVLVIPQYPGATDISGLGAYEPVQGTLRSVHVTQDSAIRVAGYYQWELGLVPVEIRPFEFVIQMQDPMTGVFTIIVIRPWSEGRDLSGVTRSADGLGAMIEVIDALTPHAGLSAAVRRLSPLDSGAASTYADDDIGFESMSGDADLEALMSGMGADPNQLLPMLMMMMMFGGMTGEGGELEWGGEWSGDFDVGIDGEWSSDGSEDVDVTFGGSWGPLSGSYGSGSDDWSWDDSGSDDWSWDDSGSDDWSDWDSDEWSDWDSDEWSDWDSDEWSDWDSSEEW